MFVKHDFKHLKRAVKLQFEDVIFFLKRCNLECKEKILLCLRIFYFCLFCNLIPPKLNNWVNLEC